MNTSPQTPDPRCGACPIHKEGERLCRKENGKHPPDCPTLHKKELIAKTLQMYKSEHMLPFARTAAVVEAETYAPHPLNGVIQARLPRLVEIVNFARHMRYTKLGLVFCIGLRNEAAIVNEVLETNGFAVASAVCKVGNIPKDELGLRPDQQPDPDDPESMCNPVLQAELMNEAAVDFNILLGLCVGHDSMFLQHVKAPATVLAVKDRSNGHNPLACVYAYDSYASYLKKPLFPNG